MDHQQLWKDRIHTEPEGYAVWLKAQVAKGNPDIAWRLDPNTPLVPLCEEMVEACPRDHVKLLEVGTGPLAVTGYKAKCGKTVNIEHTDPMAHEYGVAMRAAGLKAPHDTSPTAVEDFCRVYEARSFDGVFCCNALDHTANPLVAIFNIIHVLRPGGRAAFIHFEKEAERSKYTGLHQFSFWESGGRFFVKDEEASIDLTYWFSTIAWIGAHTETWGDGINRTITKIIKR